MIPPLTNGEDPMTTWTNRRCTCRDTWSTGVDELCPRHGQIGASRCREALTASLRPAADEHGEAGKEERRTALADAIGELLMNDPACNGRVTCDTINWIVDLMIEQAPLAEHSGLSQEAELHEGTIRAIIARLKSEGEKSRPPGSLGVPGYAYLTIAADLESLLPTKPDRAEEIVEKWLAETVDVYSNPDESEASQFARWAIAKGILR